MTGVKRKNFTGELKAKVALEAIRGIKTVNEIGQEFGVHPTQVGLWKKELQEQASSLFETKRGVKPVDPSASSERLYSEIGRLKMELDWLKKKVRDQPIAVRKQWVGATEPLPLMRQCELTGVARSTIYTPRLVVQPDEQELALLALIDAEYTRHPFYGSRKTAHYLQSLGYTINRKRVQRLMGILCLAGMAPGPHTSRRHPRHKVYPYLLRDMLNLQTRNQPKIPRIKRVRIYIRHKQIFRITQHLLPQTILRHFRTINFRSNSSYVTWNGPDWLQNLYNELRAELG